MSEIDRAEWSGLNEVIRDAQELGIYVDSDHHQVELELTRGSWTLKPDSGGWVIRSGILNSAGKGFLIAPFYASSSDVLQAAMRHDKTTETSDLSVVSDVVDQHHGPTRNEFRKQSGIFYLKFHAMTKTT